MRLMVGRLSFIYIEDIYNIQKEYKSCAIKYITIYYLRACQQLSFPVTLASPLFRGLDS